MLHGFIKKAIKLSHFLLYVSILGCTVNWEGDPAHKNQFFCPCHAGRYEKNGQNVPKTPPLGPLDQFEVRENDGFLEIGKAIPNTLV